MTDNEHAPLLDHDEEHHDHDTSTNYPPVDPQTLKVCKKNGLKLDKNFLERLLNQPSHFKTHKCVF